MCVFDMCTLYALMYMTDMMQHMLQRTVKLNFCAVLAGVKVLFRVRGRLSGSSFLTVRSMREEPA